MEPAKSKSFVVAGHEALFEAPRTRSLSDQRADDEERCDACGGALKADEDDDGYAVPGRGRYVWTRGTERRSEEPPLCADCAAAIGMTALQMWSIEEEEG